MQDRTQNTSNSRSRTLLDLRAVSGFYEVWRDREGGEGLEENQPGGKDYVGDQHEDVGEEVGVPAEVVAIDGKTVRRSGSKTSKKKKDPKGPIHIVSAFAARQRLVLGQVKVAGSPTRSSPSPSSCACWSWRGRS